MTYRRNARRRALAAHRHTSEQRVLRPAKANAWRLFWLTTEPNRRRARYRAADAATASAWDAKRAAKGLPARVWHWWRR